MTTGYAVVQRISNVNNMNKGDKTHGEVLEEIYQEFDSYLENLNPKSQDLYVFVREQGYMNTSTHITAKVLGATELALFRRCRENELSFEFEEIAPPSVKKLITGSGAAKKEDVARSLFKFVGEIDYKRDDESDAVAVGIAWLLKHGYRVRRRYRYNNGLIVPTDEQQPSEGDEDLSNISLL